MHSWIRRSRPSSFEAISEADTFRNLVAGDRILGQLMWRVLINRPPNSWSTYASEGHLRLRWRFRSRQRRNIDASPSAMATIVFDKALGAYAAQIYLERSIPMRSVNSFFPVSQLPPIQQDPNMSSTSTNLSCARCHTSEQHLAQPLKRCRACRTIQYCSQECQRSDWPQHKHHCRQTGGAETGPERTRGTMRVNLFGNTPTPNDTIYYIKTSTPHLYDISVSGPF